MLRFISTGCLKKNATHHIIAYCSQSRPFSIILALLSWITNIWVIQVTNWCTNVENRVNYDHLFKSTPKRSLHINTKWVFKRHCTLMHLIENLIIFGFNFVLNKWIGKDTYTNKGIRINCKNEHITPDQHALQPVTCGAGCISLL